MDTKREAPPFFDASKDYTISGEKVQLISFISRYCGKDGAKIRDILQDVVFPKEQEEEEAVRVRVLLGGNSVCGDERRPDSCLVCPELANCVLALFYESVGNLPKKTNSKPKV